MATCTFHNLTPEQADHLARWYANQGEQDADFWFETNGLETPMTDVQHEGGYKETDKDGNVSVYCK